MLKFVLVAATVILFLVFSIPVLVWESYLGKKDPEKRDWQSLHIVQWIFRIILKMAGVHITVKGIENIPKDKAVLYVGNHRSYFDILTGYVTVSTLMGFVAKKVFNPSVFEPDRHERRIKDHFRGHCPGKERHFCLDFPRRDQKQE